MIGVIGSLGFVSILLLVLAVFCSVVWVVIVSPFTGRLLAVPVVGGALLLAMVALLLLTPFVSIPLGVVALAAITAATGIGSVLAIRHRRPPSPDSIALWLPATLGALGWLATRAASLLIPDASRLSWAMEGDATNNLHFARRIVEDNGILLGPEQNPVPLVASLLAVPFSLDHVTTAAGSLESELWIFTGVWTALLAACCITTGVVVASVVDPARRAVVVVASAAGSLLPLTWFVAGLPIEFGYLNVHVALPLLLASWLAYLGAQRSPVIALGALVSLSALLLVTWSPVVLIPVALGTLVAARHRRQLLRAGITGLLPGAAIAVFVLLAVCLTVPSFFAQGKALAAAGHGFPATWLLLSVLAIATVAAAGLLRSRLPTGVFAGAVALVVASYAALSSTFYVARELFDPWNGYYPVKLAWLVAVLLLPVLASVVFAAAAAFRRRSWRIVAVGLTAALSVGVVVAPPVAMPAGYTARQPVERILGGHVWRSGDAAVDVIARLAERDEVGVLWDSASPDEAVINYWALDRSGGGMGGDPPLRAFAFKEYQSFRSSEGQNAFAANALCALLRDRDHAIVIYTDNPSLEDDLTADCSGATATFVVGETPGIDY
jgi:hypothetical protein